jgi:hypothetical protein
VINGHSPGRDRAGALLAEGTENASLRLGRNDKGVIKRGEEVRVDAWAALIGDIETVTGDLLTLASGIYRRKSAIFTHLFRGTDADRREPGKKNEDEQVRQRESWENRTKTEGKRRKRL